MPPVPDIFIAYDEDRQSMKLEGEYAQDYTDQLEHLLKYMTNNPIIRESVFFKKFIEIDKQFPDEFSKGRYKKTPNSNISRATMHVTHSMSNLDLMPDGYSDNVMASRAQSKHYSNMFSSVTSAKRDEDVFEPYADLDDEACNIGERDSDEFPAT